MTTAVLFLIFVAGNCKLWSEFANRIHGNPWQCRTLRRVRWLHDIGIAGFPVLMLWALQKAGWSFAALWNMTLTSWVILPACGAGFAWLVVDSLRYLFRPSMPQTELVHSTTHNVRNDAGDRPLGEAARSVVAWIPANDITEIEVNEKRLVVSGYQPGAPPLRILHLTDWHFSGTPGREFYEYAADVIAGLQFDVAVFTGDLIDRLSLLEWLPTTLGRCDAEHGCHFILGNHDWFTDHERIRRSLQEIGWQSNAGAVTAFEHHGQRIVMAGNERPWIGEAPDLVASDADVRIALCHTPDLFSWARGQDADLVLAGHNHGGQVVLPIIGPVYSPSRHGVRYAGGLYRHGKTLMHVGRGLGGLHPVRFRCKPEISVLEIVAELNGSTAGDTDQTAPTD